MSQAPTEEPGRLIFLNGTSSAGKTTLALALQHRMEKPFFHLALDQFRDGMPAQYRGLNAPEGSSGHCGLNVVPVVQGTEEPYTDVRFGVVGHRMLRGMRRAIAAMSRAGNSVIIDDIIMEDGFLTDYLQVMHGLPLYFVGVYCNAEEIGRREAARPGRFPGTALGQMPHVHAHGIYDVTVDTAVMCPQTCAERVISHVEQHPPVAFARLHALMVGA